MKCIYLGFVTAILFLLACNSNKSPESEQTPLTDNANDKEELLAVLHKWTNGYLTHDTAAVNSVQSEEWVYSGASGKLTTKAEAKAAFATSTDKYESIDYEDLQVRVYGNTGIILGKETMRIRSNDSTFTYKLRFTDVYVKKEGAWRAVTTHTSPITD